MGSLNKNINIKGSADQQRLAGTVDAVSKEGCNLKILELGCDDGSFAYHFAELGHMVVAIDLDCSDAISVRSHDNIEYINADVQGVDFNKLLKR